jgi:regulator of protease activity HflC (stomatin/prohibitin superfamily)
MVIPHSIQIKGPLFVLVATLVVGILVWLGLFVVEPTEMAGVRRFGEVTTHEPYGPGMHLKLPLIDRVDRLQVSLDILKVQDLTMYTIDNQWVKISVGMTYRIPSNAVFRLLYQVGASGSFGIRENVEPIIADRAMRVFARRNTIKISEEREMIANGNGILPQTLLGERGILPLLNLPTTSPAAPSAAMALPDSTGKPSGAP